MTVENRDDGFILVDALAGATILAFTGSIVMLAASAAISRTSSDLDRSAALMMLDSLAAELRLAGADATSITWPHEEGGVRFEITKAAGTDLRTISAFRTGTSGEALAELDVMLSALEAPGDAF